MTPAPISVERLRELLAEATPGPWSQDHRRGKDGGYRTQVFDASGDEIATLAWHAKPPRYEDGRKIISTDRAENAELIVAAVNALPALLHQLAEREAEIERLTNLRDGWAKAAHKARDLKEAAERAREEFRLLASLRLFHAPTIGYCWFERCGVSWTGKAHATINEANAEKTAAFLAASGGKVDG